MGCANTKAGGTAVTEECAPEGGDAQQQKDVPKVMVDGDDMAANGNVVNANGIEDTTDDKETAACNGDLTDSKCQIKSNNEEESSKNNDATTPSGDGNSKCANEEAKMADDEGDSKIEAADADENPTEANDGGDAASSPDKEGSESRDNADGEDE